MEHLVIRLNREQWNKYRASQEYISEIYSDNTSPYLHVHYVFGKLENEIMDEEEFQTFQNELFNF
jgi:hypothetical protein